MRITFETDPGDSDSEAARALAKRRKRAAERVSGGLEYEFPEFAG